jgi:hypothetical protein
MEDWYDHFLDHRNENATECRRIVYGLCQRKLSYPITVNLVEEVFNGIDVLFFKGKVRKELETSKRILEYGVSKKLRTSAGALVTLQDGYRIVISRSLFTSSLHNVYVNGIIAADALEACIITMEQIIVRLVVTMLGCYDKDMIRVLCYNMFGHKEDVHEMYNGDYHLASQVKRDTLLYSYVDTPGGRGMVVEKGPRNATVWLDEGRSARVMYGDVRTVSEAMCEFAELRIAVMEVGDEVVVYGNKMVVTKRNKTTFDAFDKSTHRRYRYRYWVLFKGMYRETNLRDEVEEEMPAVAPPALGLVDEDTQRGT